MRRREFITLLGGAAAWTFTARAEQPKLPTIGFLGTGTSVSWLNWKAAFIQRLHELGWVEDRTVAIVYRWAEGRDERYTEITTEFVQLKVDVIVTSGAGVAAAKGVTSTVPIIFAVAPNPLAFVESLARPGGNVTGLSSQQPDLVGKRLELLREIAPGLRRLAVMANAGYSSAVLELGEVQKVAGDLGLEVVALKFRRAAEIVPVFDGLKDRADALYVCTDLIVVAERVRISTLAQFIRLPTVHSAREHVEAGSLMSYGVNIPDLFRRAADYVDKVLRGAKPADLPVEQPTKFDLVFNLATAKALGLAIPPPLLARADEVIE